MTGTTETSRFSATTRSYESEVLTSKYYDSSQYTHDTSPSMHTGRARLMAQSWVGAGRFLTDMQLQGAGSTPWERASRVGVLYHETTKTWGFIDVALDGSSIKWCPLIVHSGLQAKLVVGGGADTMDRYEAYLLSNAKLDTDNTKTITIADLGSDLSGYKPVAYGWHFNLDGTKASCVFTKWVDLGGGTGEFSHKLVTLTFSFSELNSVATVTGSKSITTDTWFPLSRYNNVWKPRADGQMEPLMPGGNGTNSGSGCPIYCFYKDDVLTTLTYSTSSVGDVVVSDGLDPTICGTGAASKSQGNMAGDVAKTGGSKAGFVGAGLPAPTEAYSTENYQESELTIADTGSISVNSGTATFGNNKIKVLHACTGGTDPGLCSGTCWQSIFDTAGSGTYTNKFYTGNTETSSALVIPWGDAEAVYYVHRVTKDHTVWGTQYERENLLTRGKTQYWADGAWNDHSEGSVFLSGLGTVSPGISFSSGGTTYATWVKTSPYTESSIPSYVEESIDCNVEYIGANDSIGSVFSSSDGTDPSSGWSTFLYWEPSVKESVSANLFSAAGYNADTAYRPTPSTLDILTGYQDTTPETEIESAAYEPWFIGWA
ncbi:MAG: hypothetical protein GY938_02675 [Ketobacter sp.]|nr:hypothetical protein [Ketobacter sp.]